MAAAGPDIVHHYLKQDKAYVSFIIIIISVIIIACKSKLFSTQRFGPDRNDDSQLFHNIICAAEWEWLTQTFKFYVSKARQVIVTFDLEMRMITIKREKGKSQSVPDYSWHTTIAQRGNTDSKYWNRAIAYQGQVCKFWASVWAKLVGVSNIYLGQSRVGVWVEVETFVGVSRCPLRCHQRWDNADTASTVNKNSPLYML